MSRRRWLAAISAVVLVLAACSGSHPVSVPDDQMTLDIENSTNVTVSVNVNEVRVVDMFPLSHATFSAGELPSLPWHVKVLSQSGRPLLFLDVKSGDVMRFPAGLGEGISGVGERKDLSCGRLDVYSGPPMLGPMPGPGVPGDCD